MKRPVLVLICAALGLTGMFAQGIAINTTGTSADTSAMLDVSSIHKGMLVPRMTALQRAAIVLPATGLLVYQVDAPTGFYYNTGTPSTPAWLTLNSYVLAGVPVGTTDTQTVVNKTFVDTSTFFVDQLDSSKKMQLQLSGVPPGHTCVLTVPPYSTALVGTDNYQTLSNKVLASPTIYGALSGGDRISMAGCTAYPGALMALGNGSTAGAM